MFAWFWKLLAQHYEKKAAQLEAGRTEYEQKLADNPHVALKYRTHWKRKIRHIDLDSERLRQKATRLRQKIR